MRVLVGSCAAGDSRVFLCVEPELTRWEHGEIDHLRTKFEPERF